MKTEKIILEKDVPAGGLCMDLKKHMVCPYLEISTVAHAIEDGHIINIKKPYKLCNLDLGVCYISEDGSKATKPLECIEAGKKYQRVDHVEEKNILQKMIDDAERLFNAYRDDKSFRPFTFIRFCKRNFKRIMDVL